MHFLLGHAVCSFHIVKKCTATNALSSQLDMKLILCSQDTFCLPKIVYAIIKGTLALRFYWKKNRMMTEQIEHTFYILSEDGFFFQNFIITNFIPI